MTSLPFGIDSTCPLPAKEPVAHAGRPPVEGPDDPRAETARLLEEPLDFPPLSQTVVAGDQVVLALDADVPQGAQVVAAVVERLTASGIEPSSIGLLRSPLDRSGDLLAQVPESVRSAITLEVHDPEDRKKLSYLAATRSEQRVYLARTLTDADVVLPIGNLRYDGVFGYHGISTGLYPLFSDTETQTRFWGKSLTPASPGEAVKARAEADEVCWLLGVQFVVQVVAGAGDAVAEILAGDARSVYAAGRGVVDTTWEVAPFKPASLVIATLRGAANQSWQAVGRALAAVGPCVAEGGSIVLCTALADAKLGPALASLAAGENHESLLRRMLKHPSEDSFAAAQIVRALARSKVFLLSGLESQQVEDLGLAPVQEVGEVARLVERSADYAILENASHLPVWGAAK